MDINKLKETIETLRNRGSIDNPVVREVAINNALEVLEKVEANNSIQLDFQGWPIGQMTFGDMKLFVNNHQDLDDDTKLLVLQDDGMGYGANNGYASFMCVSEPTVKDGGDKEIQIWF